MSTNVKYEGGSFFLSGLLLLFIGLKLTGFIAWSWWWVLSPFWIPLVLIIGPLAIVYFVAVIFGKKRV